MGLSNLVKKCFRIYFELLGRLICYLRFRNHTNTSLPQIKDPIIKESAISMAYKIRHQEITSVEVVKSIIERIKAINPILNCMVDHRFDEALIEAEKADNLIKVSSIETLAQTKPFLGVPFTAKDLVAIKGVKLTCGIWLRRNFVAEEDAVTVQLMRNAGAIPLAITNVPELGFWWESYNTVYGRTNNAYNTCRTAGGSSGGEGAIISACGSPLGIGSDIGGSIRMPSLFNGIFGHKPTFGIVSNYGALPSFKGESNEWLVHGPMCRHASDLLPMLKVLAGDNVQKLKLDKNVDLRSLKYFYIEEFGSPLTTPVDPEIKKAQKKVIGHLEKTYNVQIKKIHLKQLESAVDIFMNNLASVDCNPSFREQLTWFNGKINIWTEFIKWMFRLSKHTWPAVNYGLIEALSPDDKKAPIILENVEALKTLRSEVQGILGEDGVLIYPTHPTLAPYHDQPFFRFYNFVYTAIPNLLKMPSTHCTLGLSSEGTPLGIQVVANLYQDHLCLALATELEKAFGGWVDPSQG